MKRRTFLRNFTIASGGLALACSGLAERARVFSKSGNPAELKAVGFGELIPTPAKNTGETYLALPKGFEYNVFGKAGSEMSDGNKTPPAHDGMESFEFGGEVRLVRNHEVTNNRVPIEGSAIGKKPYDETAGGGTVTLIFDPKTKQLVRDFVSLSGTLINCAGGKTPWRSWISCEEGTLGETVITSSSGNKYGGFKKPHGYCFEVPASANSEVEAVPLKAMGRFVHEAVAFDEKSGVVYLTEDNRPAGFYRFLPKRNKRLAEGGELQILTLQNNPNRDLRTGQQQGISYYANWVKIDNPDPQEADTNSQAVLDQGRAKGAAIFTRLEGCFTDKSGTVYFVSTEGGDAKVGQIWKYEPTGRNNGKLTLVYESPGFDILDMPDNLCQKPMSDLIFICEDGNYSLNRPIDNYLKILTPEGKIAEFAKNITPGLERSEFAGSTFTKDGEILFVNFQNADVTMAIWGDWGNFKK